MNKNSSELGVGSSGFLKVLILIIFLILLSSIAYAHEEDSFEHAKELIAQKISCEELSDEQLEIIGEHYMEQMHPGEQHNKMDGMMGGEGSESLKQMHINMAKSQYCGEGGMMGGMMNMMNGGMMGNNMMNGGMMGGMMGGYMNLIGTLYVILLIGLVIVVYLWIVKLWKDVKKKK